MFRVLLVSSVFFLVPLAYLSAQEAPSNGAPSPAAPAVNPVKPTPESQAHAKKIWGYDCAMCHGEKGNGKGDVVEAMKLTMKDYTDPAALKDMTDGQLFDIIKSGKGQMPGEGERAKPDDVWNLVILIRAMSKK